MGGGTRKRARGDASRSDASFGAALEACASAPLGATVARSALEVLAYVREKGIPEGAAAMFARGFELGLDAAVRAAASREGPPGGARLAARAFAKRHGLSDVGEAPEAWMDRLVKAIAIASLPPPPEDDEDDEDDEDESSDDASASSSSASSDASAPSSSPSDPPPPAAPPPPSATALAALAALAAPPPGALGALYAPSWLARASPAYDEHMGAENLGPALYGLCRFAKPTVALEIGGGYTSLFILQALEDNAAEARRLRDRGAGSEDAARRPKIAGMHPDAPSWYLHETVRERAESIREGSDDDEETDDDATETATTAGRGGGSGSGIRRRVATLHCVDDLSHAFSTAGVVRDAARRMNISRRRFKLHARDAWDGPPEELRSGGGGTSANASVDLLFVDFGVGARLDEFLEKYWGSVAPGGLIVVHSSVTNAATRGWLETLRANGGAPTWGGTSEGDAVHHLSLTEPHKRFQNAFTVMQKRTRGWKEPVYTEEA